MYGLVCVATWPYHLIRLSKPDAFTQVGLLGKMLQLWLGQCSSFSQIDARYESGLQEELKVWRESLKRTEMPLLQQVLCLQLLPY